MLTPLDLLYITLAIATALLTIFLCVTLVYLILILRDVNVVVDSAKDTVERVNSCVVKPINAVKQFSGYLVPLIKIVEDKIQEHMADDGSGKKKKR